MRILSYISAISAVVALILFLGCTPQQEPEDVPPAPKVPEQRQEQEPESAKEIIENYGEGLVTSMDKARSSQARVDIGEVRRAVQDYALEHDGAYPSSLDEVSGSLTGIDLSAFNYNPANGGVSIKNR